MVIHTYLPGELYTAPSVLCMFRSCGMSRQRCRGPWRSCMKPCTQKQRSKLAEWHSRFGCCAASVRIGGWSHFGELQVLTIRSRGFRTFTHRTTGSKSAWCARLGAVDRQFNLIRGAGRLPQKGAPFEQRPWQACRVAGPRNGPVRVLNLSTIRRRPPSAEPVRIPQNRTVESPSIRVPQRGTTIGCHGDLNRRKFSEISDI